MFKKKNLSLALALGVSLSAGMYSQVASANLLFSAGSNLQLTTNLADPIAADAVTAYDAVVIAQTALESATGAAAIAAAQATLDQKLAVKNALTGPVALAVYAEKDAVANYQASLAQLNASLGADATVAGSLRKAEADAIAAVNAVSVPGYTPATSVYADLLAKRSAVVNAADSTANEAAVKDLADFESKLTATNKNLIAVADAAASNVDEKLAEITALGTAETARQNVTVQALQDWSSRALEAKAQATTDLAAATETEAAKLELLAEAQADFDAGKADSDAKKAALEAANTELTAAHNAHAAATAVGSTATADQIAAATNRLNQAETAAAAAKTAFDTAAAKVATGTGALEVALNAATTGAKAVAEAATGARVSAQDNLSTLTSLANIAEDSSNPAGTIAAAIATTNQEEVALSIVGAVSTNYGHTQENAADIATNTVSIASNTAGVATNAGNIATNTTNIATNRADIDTNTTNIATNRADIETNTAGIATNAGNIATNTTNITTNTANIASNRTDINSNTAGITANSGRIDTNAAGITQLNSDVDLLRSGIASALAVAGMPMTPGSGWGASIGTGYFDGESAIAAGLVYKGDRYNFKFAVGNSGGETSASAGVSMGFK